MDRSVMIPQFNSALLTFAAVSMRKALFEGARETEEHLEFLNQSNWILLRFCWYPEIHQG